MKEIIDVVNVIPDLLRRLMDMSGGKKRGYAVYWTFIVLIALLLFKPAYESASFVFSKINIASPVIQAIGTLIFVVVGFVMLFAVVTLVAAVPAQLLRSLLDSGYRIRLNDTYIALLTVLRETSKEQPSSIQLKQLLESTEALYTKWRKVKTNVLLNWIAPTYFKKDTLTWKLVSIDAKSEKRNELH